MDTIYITGHRNPDTDSIVSAMAYAALKNALGQRQYEAARLGQISDETPTVLDRFGFQPPKLLNNVRTQVRDLDYDTPATLSAAATISRAWRTMQKDKISAIPVANEDGTLFGMLSAGDVANYDMSSVRNPKVGEIPVYNLLSVLEGKILNQGGEMRDVISGDRPARQPGEPGVLRPGQHRGLRRPARHDPPCAGDRRQLHHRLSGGGGPGAAGHADGHLHHLHRL